MAAPLTTHERHTGRVLDFFLGKLEECRYHARTHPENDGPRSDYWTWWSTYEHIGPLFRYFGLYYPRLAARFAADHALFDRVAIASARIRERDQRADELGDACARRWQRQFPALWDEALAETDPQTATTDESRVARQLASVLAMARDAPLQLLVQPPTENTTLQPVLVPILRIGVHTDLSIVVVLDHGPDEPVDEVAFDRTSYWPRYPAYAYRRYCPAPFDHIRLSHESPPPM